MDWPSPEEARARLAAARLQLVFTPALCGGRDPLAVLDAALPHVDVVQVRPKAPDRDLDPARAQRAAERSDAREAYAWTQRVLERVAAARAPALVLVNDRADVARALLDRGCAGVHLGQDDAPPRVARDLLGPAALICLSTHSQAQVLAAGEEPVDCLGFGPVFPSGTKGYVRGLGAEAAWIAQSATHLPLFPIGGVDLARAGELEPVGRAAVASAVLAAEDPGRAAAALRALLAADGDALHRSSIASP